MAKSAGDKKSEYFKRLVRSQILAMEAYSPGPASQREDVVVISSNENGFGAPPAVIEGLRAQFEGAGRIHRYPDVTCRALRTALSEKHQIPPEWFLVGNGLDDIINMIATTFLTPEDNVLVPAATFGVYAGVTRMMGAAPAVIPMREDLSIDIDAMERAITSGTKLIFLCSPNNPTGTVIRRSEFDALLEKLEFMPIKPLLIVDQAYIDFADAAPETLNAIKYVTDYGNIAVLRTFSKLSGLAGLRVGYMAAHPEMISYMYRVRPPYTVNSLAQAAALIDLRDPSAAEFRERANSSIRKSRSELEKFLKDRNVPYIPSQANFVFAFYGMTDEKLRAISDELFGRGILVRVLKHDRAPGGLRFSIGTPDENRKLIAALEEILSEKRQG
ncbi:MAG: histidinol-phosphate transaminase [Synergistaceae bacterium]|nr:histidinol-phosphate transaminase [Synergistaceae bacterium]